ncbi:uroporphyrinogen decarboxylase [Legionella sp. CNM-1927-20]|uniref:uroporphyrinogen decarboxylase n=1 Tax=Legionella sp. CNM-1927-20 TaxID=3422221 RepID=UPI00403B0592
MSDVANSLLIRALQRKPIPRTPVWLMRQAGRYLPEYRQVRAKVGDFLNLCKTPELACEVTLQPLRRYPLDAAIVFSDILTIPDAMGLGLYFAEGEGPCFHTPLQSAKAIEAVNPPNIGNDLAYVFDAIKLIRREMPKDLPLIGFSGSPWTLACYMVEGKSSRNFNHMMTLLDTQPEVAHILLMQLAQAVKNYLLEQVLAGVNAVMIFDTWGGLLTTKQYQQFSLQYMQQIVHAFKQIHPDIPVILFTKGGGKWLKEMAATGCDALSLDWTCELGYARALVGEEVALQGNLEPALLLKSDRIIREHVKKVLDSYGYGSGHVFNLGHGITPDILPEKVAVMIEAVEEFSPTYHNNL